MIKLNEVRNENCLDTMKLMDDNFIDLTVTSPPYDNLRDYKGYSFDFESIAKELYRTTKEGGVVVWVVGDATVKGSETGTSFKQALFFKECGFNLHDTMIWQKNKIVPRDPRLNRYYQDFEYMFVFSKGKPKSCNYIMVDCIHKGKNARAKQTNVNGSYRTDRYDKMKDHIVKDKKIKSNTWIFSTTRSNHPAVFPEQLANDHIISWSNEGDLVYDPFMGSGTTAKMAKINNREYIGSEMSSEYCEIIKERLSKQSI